MNSSFKYLGIFRIFPKTRLIAGIVLLFFVTPKDSAAQEKHTFGWVEKSLVYPGAIELKAKLDTGAENSSLHAENIELVEKGKKKWARFVIYDRRRTAHILERKVVGMTKIKRHGKSPRRRAVVRLTICLNSTHMEVDVSLENRKRFEYPLLIGRNFLAGNALVDSSSIFTTEPHCEVEQDTAQ